MKINIIYNTGEKIMVLAKSKDELELSFLDDLRLYNKDEKEDCFNDADIKKKLNNFLSKYRKIKINNEYIYVLHCYIIEKEDRWIEDIQLYDMN